MSGTSPINSSFWDFSPWILYGTFLLGFYVLSVLLRGADILYQKFKGYELRGNKGKIDFQDTFLIFLFGFGGRKFLKTDRYYELGPLKWKRIVPFYSLITDECVPLYQDCFDKTLEQIDITNMTRWSYGKGFDEDRFERDTQTRIRLGKEIRLVGSPYLLHIMVEQFIFADMFEREVHKAHWVETVRWETGQERNFFPHPVRVARSFFVSPLEEEIRED